MQEDRDRLGPVMGLMFLSGAAALAYEIIWMRMLSRAFGVTVHAVAALVALYMGGLALGAYGAPRLRWRGSWLRLYAWLEAGAGLAALLGTWWMLRLPAVVAALSCDHPLAALPRLLLAAPALLPATCLLGATLPTLTRHCGSAGKLYAANTLGAMTGLAIVSFWTIGRWGETSTILLAVALNAAAASGAALLSRGAGPVPVAPSAAPAAAALRPSLVLGLFAVSGFCALGYEIIWARQLVLLLGNSTYAFAMLLLVYLGGIGAGSLLPIDLGDSPTEAFATLLAALGFAAVLSLASYRFMGLGIDSPEFLYSPLRRFSDFPLLFAQAIVIILPVALMLGALFPIAVKVCSRSCDEATAVGRLYAWNTAGGIAGSLWAGFAGLSWLGAHRSFLLLAGLQTALGLAAAAWLAVGRRRWLGPAAFAACALCLIPYVRRDPTLDIIRNRLRQVGYDRVEVMFHDESPAATITGAKLDRSRTLYINGIETSGKGWAGTWMALLPSLLAENSRSALVICLGAGNTLGAAAALAGSVDGVELVADVARRIPVFQSGPELTLPAGVKPRIFIEDGRNYLLRTQRRYDFIIVDAAPPLYSAGTVNLYTKEFMELARRRLEDGGVFTLWLPTKSFESDYWQIMRGMSDVFEHVAVWDKGWSGFLILGSSRPLAWDGRLLDSRIRERAGAFGLKLTGAYVLSGLRLSDREIRDYVRPYAPVTDDRPSVEFPLPRFWKGEALRQTSAFLGKAHKP
jgi:spermidine synthase